MIGAEDPLRGSPGRAHRAAAPRRVAFVMKQAGKSLRPAPSGMVERALSPMPRPLIERGRSGEVALAVKQAGEVIELVAVLGWSGTSPLADHQARS